MESEQFIRVALEQLFRDRMTFIIAHRLATVVNANLIVVLDKGEIIDQGTHQELFERCSLHRDLCETHFLSNFEPGTVKKLRRIGSGGVSSKTSKVYWAVVLFVAGVCPSNKNDPRRHGTQIAVI